MLIILILLTILLNVWLKKMLENRFLRIKKDCEDAEAKYGSLLKDSQELEAGIIELSRKADESIALYDITKEICKSLDEDKVFSSFCEQLNKYIAGLKNCRFLKGDVDLSQYKGSRVLPLKIDKNTFSYLAAEGVEDDSEDKFNILGQQLLLGIKRAVFYRRVQELSMMDGLTEIFSRRYYLERFKEEMARSKKFKYRFSCLMIDIDHFRRYNEDYGHLVGDAVLKEVSAAIKDNVRQIDLVGRYGGEEFGIILTETDREQAKFAAERIRQNIEGKRVKVYDEDLKVTVSVGISVFPTDAQDVPELIDKADSALYQAKQSGRNRVCLYKAN